MDAIFYLPYFGLFLVISGFLIFGLASITAVNEQVILGEGPLSSVGYSGGEFHVTYIEDGRFRSVTFDTCTIGDRDALIKGEMVKQSFLGPMFAWESNSLMLTNETLARIGAIA